jgi:hypothetical protein
LLKHLHRYCSYDDPAKWQAIAGRHKKEGIEANNQVRNIIKIIKFPNPSRNILDKDMTLVKYIVKFDGTIFNSGI